MNRNTLNKELLHSGKYKMKVVKSKKGKGSYKRLRNIKHLNGAFLI